MTMPKDGGRIKRDLDAVALEAARAHLDRGMHTRAATKAFKIGWDRFTAALEKLRRERAA